MHKDEGLHGGLRSMFQDVPARLAHDQSIDQRSVTRMDSSKLRFSLVDYDMSRNCTELDRTTVTEYIPEYRHYGMRE